METKKALPWGNAFGAAEESACSFFVYGWVFERKKEQAKGGSMEKKEQAGGEMYKKEQVGEIKCKTRGEGCADAIVHSQSPVLRLSTRPKCNACRTAGHSALGDVR